MKKNIIFAIIGFTLLLITACEKELELSPETLFTDGQVFSSEAGVEAAVNGMWVHFNSSEYHGASFHTLLNPHSGRFYSNQGASSDATSLNCQPNNTWLERMWPGMYSAINDANVIIENLENTTLDLPNKNYALGQAYFIRGLSYFDLVQLFGDVPLKTAPASKETLFTSRTPKAEVYAQVISDLEKSKTLLPDFGEYRSERPVKYAANAFLAKVYMRMAGEDDGNPSYWQKAYDEAIQVYGKYTLLPSYADLFSFNDNGPINENTEESILELQYGLIGAVRSNDIARSYTPSNYYLFPASIPTFGRVRPNKEVFDEHVAQYPGDPRIDVTFIFDEYVRNNGAIQKTYPAAPTGNNGFPYLKKYLDPTYNGTNEERNMIIMRYAEVLLMLAEIENELNGPDNAYQYVNAVLSRARNTVPGSIEPADWSGMTQDEFRNRIMNERKYELLGEGQDWFDTRRRGYEYFLKEVVGKHNDNPTFDPSRDYEYPISVKNMLLPIPASEISTNEEINQGDQNPGY